MQYFSRDQLERAKLTIEIIAILVVLFIGIAVVFWFPAVWSHVRENFAKAGVRVDEVSVLGVVKFKAVETLSVAESTLSKLQKDYETAIDLLQCAARGTCSTEQESQIDSAIAAAPDIVGTAGLAQEQIGKAIAYADHVVVTEVPISDARPASSFVAPGSWIAVTGADRELSSARFEEGDLGEVFDDVAILRVDDWFRVRTHKRDSLVSGFVIHGLRREIDDESRLFLADRGPVQSSAAAVAERYAGQAAR